MFYSVKKKSKILRRRREYTPPLSASTEVCSNFSHHRNSDCNNIYILKYFPFSLSSLGTMSVVLFYNPWLEFFNEPFSSCLTEIAPFVATYLTQSQNWHFVLISLICQLPLYNCALHHFLLFSHGFSTLLSFHTYIPWFVLG